MLSFGNILCAAQSSARPKSSFPFYEKLYTYGSPRVSDSAQIQIFFPMKEAIVTTPYSDFNLKVAIELGKNDLWEVH